jgi:TM2 domain-containing membrane protein YozV
MSINIKTREFKATISYLLLFFFGIFGAHRFYFCKPWTGALYLFTAGLFGVGIIYDAVIGIPLCVFEDQRTLLC